ncbi:phage portal protein [Sutcliffiella horikoshii]|uniref:Phage portal protein n=1 Tax=Sutcliffiella horikoshii TaxID=79883 RepID=A0A5D4SB57_9BACI|nr:phage portal protein [Sutcliffiella horikoshii]TYS60480.1 phage portal protein [Sutcliffiella horikoshii]
MSVFKVGGYFPPEDHEERIKRYVENKKLFKGEHFEVFQDQRKHFSKKQEELLYLAVNLPAIICKKSADFLFGEPCAFNAGNDDNSNEQKALERIYYQNDFNILNYESALGSAYRGDSFIKLRYGQRWDGLIKDKNIDPYRVFIESQNAEYVFPETLQTDAKTIFCYHIAFPVKEKRITTRYFLKVESHYPGLIVYREYELSPFTTDVKGNVTQYKIIAEVKDSIREVKTGLPFPLVVHIPNYSLDDEWQGIDDLSEHKSLFDEVNMRLSLIAEILDKHSDPAMAVPTGSLGEDEQGNPIFHAGRDKIFEYEKGDAEPKYITWNGQLDAAFKELEKLLDIIFILTEIPPVVLGKDNSGTSGSSGLSIKWRMNSILSKVNRKRQYFEKAHKRILLIAQLLEHKKMSPDYQIIENPRILYKDGLPDDEMEKANIANMRTGGMPTKSQKTAIMEMDGLTEEQAEKEIQRIREEEQQASFVSGSIFNEVPNQETEVDES